MVAITKDIIIDNVTRIPFAFAGVISLTTIELINPTKGIHLEIQEKYSLLPLP